MLNLRGIISMYIKIKSEENVRGKSILEEVYVDSICHYLGEIK